jgi:hypothetical protein
MRRLTFLVPAAILAVAAAACVPPPPPPPPPPVTPAPTAAPATTTTTKAPVTTTTTKAPVTTTTTKAPVTTTTPAPVEGWAQNGSLGSCSVFPANNAWNRDVSTLPVHANSTNYVNTVLASGSNKNLHADFGGGGEYGIPYITVPGTQPLVPVNFVDYGDESDPGPYPIPLNAPIEGGGDRHVLAVDRDQCKLYELYAANPAGSRWDASSGAVFDLTSNALRPDGWTSADAAGLPIFPGLVRYDEVASGNIDHALRFTVSQSQRAYLHPATHWAASSTDPNRPPMGLQFRLKANFDISRFSGQTRVILEALKKYGMIVADNGSNWFVSGAQDTRWNDTDLNQLKTIPGSAFEVVDTGEPLHK